MTAVNARSGTISAALTRAYREVKRGYTFVCEGDVLFVKITPCMQNGKHAVARGLIDRVGFASTEFHVLRSAPTVLAEWVHSYLRQPSILKSAEQSFTGSAGQQRVRAGFLRLLEIPLPPIPDQQRILGILDEHLAHVERARAAAEAQLAAAKALPAAYLRVTFKDVLGRQWPKRRLADVCNLLPSRSIATDGDTVAQAITTACLTERGFRPEGVKPARMWAQDAEQCVVRRGEILVARSNTAALVGRACMFDGARSGVVASDLTIRIETRAEMHPSFVAAFLSFLYVTGYWQQRAGGASGSMKKITRSQLENESLPAPSMEEQARIARELSQALAEGDRIQRALEEQMRAIEGARTATLRRAFTGQL
jgi:type I restriction enzyme S subunit